MRICWSNRGDSDQPAHVYVLVNISVAHVKALDYLISSYCVHVIKILNDFSVLRNDLAYRSDLKK